MKQEKSEDKKIEAFLDVAPVGRDNAVGMRQLARRAHMGERAAREMVAKVNTSGKGMIINLSDGKGYFRADESEKHLKYLYKAQEVSRFVSQKDKLEGINRYLGEEKPKRESELEKNQISMFEWIGGE